MTTKKFIAFKMKLLGHTNTQIAKKTGWSEYTLRHYFSSKGKWHKEYLEWSRKEIDSVKEVLHSAFKAHALEASWKLFDLVHSDNPSIVLRASQDVLDRAGFQKSSIGFMQTNQGEDSAEDIMVMMEKMKTKRKDEHEIKNASLQNK